MSLQTDYREIERKFARALELGRRPVAVAFRDAPPEGVEKFAGREPSGCSFWRLAAQGRVFYTMAADHYNCPVGSYTHGIELPAERAQELPEVLGLMARIGYINMEEVPGIPRLQHAPVAIVFAPLGETPVEPDVVIFAGTAGKIMVLQEAALRAGAAPKARAAVAGADGPGAGATRTSPFAMLGRPTCMALPAAIAHGSMVSAGCIGNRVYTDLAPGELYGIVPVRDLQRVAEQVATVAAANAQLADYHKARRAQLATE